MNTMKLSAMAEEANKATQPPERTPRNIFDWPVQYRLLYPYRNGYSDARNVVVAAIKQIETEAQDFWFSRTYKRVFWVWPPEIQVELDRLWRVEDYLWMRFIDEMNNETRVPLASLESWQEQEWMR
jgi:hypothetical protein